MLVRNADSIAASDDFFAFQQQIQQFFRLLEGVPRAPELEREEVRPVLEAMLVHAPVQSHEILHVRAVGVYRVEARLLAPFVDRLLALVDQAELGDQLLVRDVEAVGQSRPRFDMASERAEHLLRARFALPLDNGHRLLAGAQSHRDAPLVPRKPPASLPVRFQLDLGMGRREALPVDVDVAREDDRILP